MKNKKYPKHVIFVNEAFDLDPTNITSVHECTGLIPWGVSDEEQYDAYDEIYKFSPESANIYNYKE